MRDAITLTVAFILMAALLLFVSKLGSTAAVNQTATVETGVEAKVNTKTAVSVNDLMLSIEAFKNRTLMVIPTVVLLCVTAGVGWTMYFSAKERRTRRTYEVRRLVKRPL